MAEHPYVSARGLSLETTAARFEIGYYAGPGIMTGRLAIPIHDEQGRLVAYCGRSVASEVPRYKLPAGFRKSAVLFNYHRAAAVCGRRVVVVEGFFDCMRGYQAGFASVVALMGAALSPFQADLLAGRFTDIVLMLDGDPAGQQACTMQPPSSCGAAPFTESSCHRERNPIRCPRRKSVRPWEKSVRPKSRLHKVLDTSSL